MLAADTVVTIDGLILGKPADAADARRMLALLSGRTHQVMTAVVLIPPGGAMQELVESTDVTFRPISAAEIDAYVASGEPFDKAGAYAIQGGAGAFVVQVRGSYSNVVGLPVAVVYRMCKEAGLLIS